MLSGLFGGAGTGRPIGVGGSAREAFGRLPPVSAAKVRHKLAKAEDDGAAIYSLTRQRDQQRDIVYRLSERAKQMASAPIGAPRTVPPATYLNSGFRPNDIVERHYFNTSAERNRAVAAADGDAAAAKADLDELNARIDALSEARSPALDRALRWVGSLPLDVVLADRPVKKPAAKGDPAAVERLRAEHVARRAEFERVRAAPLPARPAS